MITRSPDRERLVSLHGSVAAWWKCDENLENYELSGVSPWNSKSTGEKLGGRFFRAHPRSNSEHVRG